MLQFHVIIIILILSITCSDRLCHSFLQPRVRHNINCGHFRTTPLLSLARSTPLKKKTKVTGTDYIPDLNNTTPQLDEQQLIYRLGISYGQKVMELSRFKSENGHCLVPKRYDKNPSLGNWVNKQRQLYRKYLKGDASSMTKDRIDALTQIGFVFDTSCIPTRSFSSDRAWQTNFDKLSEFHRTHGHTNVPSSSPLGQWTVRQRYFYRSKSLDTKLSKERINLLNSLGFHWSTRYEVLWDQRVIELKEFKQKHGHCMVPRNYEPNPQLSSWVATQRKSYKLKMNGKSSYLTDQRQKQLEDLDFVWSYWDYNFRINEF
ncbi:hypothetical protein ACHAW6_014726 [Cyclotella cf. meneghiniana]